MRSLEISLTAPQAEFATASEHFPAIVAGFGSGKTEALVNRLMLRKVAFPQGWVGYYAPSYDLVSKIFYPRLEELLARHRIAYRLNKQEKLITVQGYGIFIARTMDKPASIVGYEHADAGVDELDTLPHKHAEDAWRKIIARNRQKKPFGDNTVAVATTPEGYRFVYERWKKDPKPGYRLIQASTHSNLHNLPPDYIEKLEQDYPKQLLAAYVNGEFCNLTSGSVYPEFDRALNGCKEVAMPHETLHVGLDFNVGKMAAVVFVIRDNKPVAVDELSKIRDTPAMIESILTRFRTGARHIIVYPDASGGNTSSKSASVSDIILLQQAGLEVSCGSKNPLIKDRVASVNALILNAAGERRLRVNVDKCPEFVRALEQQPYALDGFPDKTQGLDHVIDAAGYFLYRRWPVASAVTRLKLGGT